MWCAHHKIYFFNFQGTNQVSHAASCIVSNTNFLCIDTKPRAKRASPCQDIYRNQCAPTATKETKIQIRQLRPPWRSDFGPGRRSRVSVRSGNTNLQQFCTRKGSGLAKISAIRGRSSWGIEEGLIGNQLLRPEWRSYFGPGGRLSVFRRSENTNLRGGRVRISREIRDSGIAPPEYPCDSA